MQDITPKKRRMIVLHSRRRIKLQRNRLTFVSVGNVNTKNPKGN